MNKVATPEQTFLGTGWSFPPTFLRRSCTVAMVSGVVDVRESLWILLSTMKGERIMLPTYGCDIWRMVFQGINTTLIGQVEHMVANAILNWEPRVTVDNVVASVRPGAVGILDIGIDYIIRTTNSRSNLVYPFYLEEGTIPPVEP